MMIPKAKVSIPGLPIGNLAAVANMVRKCGGDPIITNNPSDLYNAERIILAGVGAFDAGMQALGEGGWLQPLNSLAQQGKTPILGICLGMQLMCQGSEEGIKPGLGWFEADVKLITPLSGSGLKVPHMGWNTVKIINPCHVLPQTKSEKRFYFVHSFHVVCRDPSDVVATTFYGCELTSAIARRNLYGVQFHPEKSHRFGMSLIQQFLKVEVG